MENIERILKELPPYDLAEQYLYTVHQYSKQRNQLEFVLAQIHLLMSELCKQALSKTPTREQDRADNFHAIYALASKAAMVASLGLPADPR
jgi:predicted nucleotide-binding protein (sugar kinase/HSP70/actin superfamily)